MNVLVLNGSPKRGASDTLNITRAFVDGMRDAAPVSLRTIHVLDEHIEYCTGCLGCMRNGGNCIHNDDMRRILEDILDSDVLIFSFPLYCYGMPAPLKALIDRTLPLSSIAMQKVGDHYEHVGQRDFSRLRYVMISGCGFPNSEHNFEPAVQHFRRMFGEDATVLTVAESPLFNIAEAAPVAQPYLEIVRRAGSEYARDGAISEETMAALAVPMIPQETYAAMVNGTMQP